MAARNTLNLSPGALLRASKRELKSALAPLVRNALRPPAPPLPPSRWGLEVDPARGLCLEGVALHGLLERWGSPLHVVHGAALDRNVGDFLHVPAGLPRGAEVYYSYKTNPIPGVLRRMHAAGVGAEVISEHELWMALELGVPPERIVYNGPGKSDASLREAIARDILLLNVNHREELARVAHHARALGKRPRVGVRITVPGGWSGQFGVPVEGGEALEAYREALAEPSLDVVGVHAHYGMRLRTAGQLSQFVGQVLAFCDALEAATGWRPGMLDLGGSLAVPTAADIDPREQRMNQLFQRPVSAPDPAATLPIRAYVDAVLRQVEAHAQARGRPAPRVLLEPGRAMTGNTQLLLSRVMTVKATRGATAFAVMDAGQNLAEIVRNEYHQVFAVNRAGAPATRDYTWAGPICSPGDVLFPAVRLPELSAGDSVAVMDAGAYFVPFSTSFSFPQPAIVLVDGGEVSLLRRAETSRDLLSLDR
jgi:diaminopimelate decarboxylase